MRVGILVGSALPVSMMCSVMLVQPILLGIETESLLAWVRKLGCMSVGMSSVSVLVGLDGV